MLEAVKKYYDRNAVTIATFLGGPLAAGMVLRRNYINNGKREQGNIALYLSILITLIALVIVYQVTNDSTLRLMNLMMPAFFTGLVFLFFDKLQGRQMEFHKERDGKFYSRWRAAGTGVLSALMVFTGVVAYELSLGENNLLAVDNDEEIQNNLIVYDEKMNSFANMELMALDVFNLPEGTPKEHLLYQLKDRGIYYWNENIILLNELNRLALPEELYQRNNMLKKYCDMRLKSYELIYQAIDEDTDKYRDRILDYNNQIEKLLSEIPE